MSKYYINQNFGFGNIEDLKSFIMKFTTNKLIIFVSIFLVLFDNYLFFNNLIEVYPINSENIYFLISLGIFLIIFTTFLFAFVSFKYTT